MEAHPVRAQPTTWQKMKLTVTHRYSNVGRQPTSRSLQHADSAIYF